MSALESQQPNHRCGVHPPTPQFWSKWMAWTLATLVFGILVLRYAEPVGTQDLWWHMVYGRHILATSRLIVDHSIFTWTPAESYFVYNSWIPEVLLYLTYHSAGAIGLLAYVLLAFGGFFALAVHFAIHRQVATNPIAWGAIILGAMLASGVALVQPELFSFMFMFILVWLFFTIRAAGAKARYYWYALPILMVLWVNSHGAFIFSALFLLSAGVGELLNVQASPERAMPTDSRYHFFLAQVLCVAALFINPFGYELPLDALNTIVNRQSEFRELLANTVSAYLPTSAFNEHPYFFIDYLILAMVIYVFLLWQDLKKRRTDWVSILAFLAYCWLFVQFGRTAFFLGPVFTFVSLDLLANKVDSWAWPDASKIQVAIAAFVLALIGLIGWRSLEIAACFDYSGSIWAGTVEETACPVEETAYIQQLPNVQKVGNLYDNGGYLMYKLWPGMKTTIDGRYFPFRAWFEKYKKFEEGVVIQEFLDEHQADVWLVEHRWGPLLKWLSDSKDWQLTFIGTVGAVFERAQAKSPALKITTNIDRITSLVELNNLFRTAILLQNWPLATTVQSQAAKTAAWRPLCERYQVLAEEMVMTSAGLQAFMNGDYELAVAKLRNVGTFFSSPDVETKALWFLAERAWGKGDYAKTRMLAFEALRILPRSVVAIYNAAIADWQYKQQVPSNQPSEMWGTPPHPTSQKIAGKDVTWEFLANLILRNQERVPKEIMSIIGTLTAMQNGTLKDKPAFIVVK